MMEIKRACFLILIGLALLVPGIASSDPVGLKIAWSESSVKENIPRGRTVTRQIDLMVFEDMKTLSFKTSSSVEQMVTVSPATLTDLKAGEVHRLELNFSATEDAKIRPYNGTLHPYSLNGSIPEILKLHLRVEPAPALVLPEEEGPDNHTPHEIRIVAPSRSIPLNENTINRPKSLWLELVGGAFSGNKYDHTVLRNGEPIEFSIQDGLLKIPYPVVDGYNQLEIYGRDSEGRTVEKAYEFWGGNENFSFQIKNEDGSYLEDGTAFLTVRIARAPHVFFTKNLFFGGTGYNIGPIPVREPVIFEVTTTDGRRFATSIMEQPDYTVNFYKYSFIDPREPSPTYNADFSAGSLVGWDTTKAKRVFLVPHSETDIPEAIEQLRPSNEQLVAAQSLEQASDLDNEHENIITLVTPTSASYGDLDLVIGTSGEGMSRAVHAYRVSGDVKAITVRYRFITFEVPGGYYDTRFNDFYTVTAGSRVAGTFVAENRSMNSLGLDSFDSFGATAWRELSLPIAGDGDIVQIEVGVANVGDSWLDSFVQVDLVAEKPLRISDVAFNDDPGVPQPACRAPNNQTRQMKYFSFDEQPYFPAIPIYGTISIEGPEGRTLSNLSLEVLAAGEVIAEGSLTAEAQETLLIAFDEEEIIQVVEPIHLFDVSGSAAIANSTIELRVKAEMESSAGPVESTEDVGVFPRLAHHDLPLRYLERNEAEGGDSWVQPEIMDVLTEMNNRGFIFGDFSNMHGGTFYPHCSHFNGRRVDATFEGLHLKDAIAAQRVLDLLNDPEIGSEIRIILTTFDAADESTDPFWLTINGVVLNDGRRATDVIRSYRNHDTHMHIGF